MSRNAQWGWHFPIVGVFASLCLGGAVLADGRSDYSGVWIVDEEQSENPQEKIRAALPVWMRPMASWGNGGSSEPARRLEIKQADDAVTIRGSEGREQTLMFGGTPTTEPEGRMTSEAAWEDDDLVIVSHSNRGATIHRRYVLNGDGSQLTIHIRIDHPRLSETVIAQRVFDRADAS